MDQISVLLIENELACLRGLSNYLNNEEYINVIGKTTSKKKGVALAKQLDANVVLLSIPVKSSTNSILATAEITSSSNSKVIILTEKNEENIICQAYKAGAINYIDKANFEEIPGAIFAAYYGRSPIRPYFTRTAARQEYIRLRDIEQQFEIAHMKSLLTPTEINILFFIACGHSQRDISKLLFVSLSTIKNHVYNILRKTGKNSSKKAAQKAKRMGFFIVN